MERIFTPGESGEAGFTLVELMVAVVVLALGILGLAGSLEGSRALNTVAENNTVMTHVAQRQIEQLHDVPFTGLVLNAPGPTADPSHVANKYVCSGSPAQYSWNQSGCAAGDTKEPMVIAPTGVTNRVPFVKDWFDARSGRRGQIHTYITWVNDADCPSTPADLCPGTQDYKRLTIVVTLSNGKPRTPVIISGFAYDSDSDGRFCSDPLIPQGSCG